MSTFTKKKLSGSVDGRGIKVVKTGTPGTAVHAAVAGTTDFDEVWLFAYNGGTANVVLTVEFGGATVPDDNIIITLVYKTGLQLIVPGLVLQNECVVKAFASVADVVVITGFVNRIIA